MLSSALLILAVRRAHVIPGLAHHESLAAVAQWEI